MIETLRERVKDSFGAAVFPITVDTYYSMMYSGKFIEGDSIELIDGMIVLKDRGDLGSQFTGGPRHASAVDQLNEVLGQVLSLGCLRRIQNPLTLGPTQVPEPDGAVIYGKRGDFVDRHLGPGEIALVVEVANTSLNYDRTTKQAVYAAAGSPNYWIVNLIDDILEVYSQPQIAERCYNQRSDNRPDQTISLELLPGKVFTFALADLFPS
jgi:Uma2 family endonuclease